MFYYEAPIKVENGKKVYGDLPIHYTVAYENEELNMAYFPSRKKLDDFQEVTEITEDEYNTALSEINKLNNDKRQVEFEETRSKVQQKQLQQDLKIAQSSAETVQLMSLLSEQQKLEQAKANAELTQLIFSMLNGGTNQ